MELYFDVWEQSTQEIGHFLQNQLEQTASQTIGKFVNTLDQAQTSLTEMTATTSGIMETAITSYVSDFVTQYPIISKILNTLNWTINHPIMSVVMLLLIIAIFWSIVRGIVRLIETVSWSIFKVPFRLLKVVFIIGFKQITQLLPLWKLQNSRFNKLIDYPEQQNNHYNFHVLSVNTKLSQDRQARLLAINHRLDLIHKEQQQLLKEAANLINSDK
ncbi:MAG: hypothetical protein F6K62_14160 [Sphaerospermopsis sp. SIO1G2]|nr:hypothetical protein [Sphaerospermopsis sp. SIO1G2]